MSTTNTFTVRAEDHTGAFADREFSITVRNTAADRFVYVDATDAYTSPDMTNWTKRTGYGGTKVSYGGGIWVIKRTAATSFWSTDGVVWNSVVPTNLGSLSIAGEWVFCEGAWYVLARSNFNHLIMFSTVNFIDYTSVALPTHIAFGGTPTCSPSGHYIVMQTSLTSFIYDTRTKTTFTLNAPNSLTVSGGNVSMPLLLDGTWYLARSNTNGTIGWMARSDDLVTWRHGEPTTYSDGASFMPTAYLNYYNGVFYASGKNSASQTTSWGFSLDGHTVKNNIVITENYTNNGFANTNVFFANGRVYATTGAATRPIYESSDLMTFAPSTRFPTTPVWVAQAL